MANKYEAQVEAALSKALSENDYQTAQQIIEKNDKLVNFVNSEGDSVLMSAINSRKVNKDFVLFIVSHRDFKLNYFKQSKKNGYQYSNIDSLFEFSDPEVLKKVIHNNRCKQRTDLIYLRDGEKIQLSYQYLLKKYEKEFLAYQKSKSLVLFQKIENLREIILKIRKETVRYATEVKNLNLFNSLEKAGDDLIDPVLNIKQIDRSVKAKLSPSLFSPPKKIKGDGNEEIDEEIDENDKCSIF